MPNLKRSWILVIVTVAGAFSLLGFFGREVYRQAPPIPARVESDDGRLLFTSEDILDGQQVWQSAGGQQLGSIWGHGAYQAPDWSADWLHREATALLEIWAAASHGRAFADLTPMQQGALKERLRLEMRQNTYDAERGVLVLSADRVAAIEATAVHYRALFGDDPALAALRDDYAMPDGTIPSAERREKLTQFFFWASWACATERPGSNATYTNNWPHEPLIDNRPTGANMFWSLASIFGLLAVLGGLVWWRAFRKEPEEATTPPDHDPLATIVPTPSMKAVGKYLAVVIALFVVQVLLGALTAHYTVEGRALFGLPLGDVLPYSLTRTWHVQTGLFWIATSFLAAGLFLPPAIGGREPRGQRLGVNLLFGALVVVVGGSLLGEALSVHQKLGLDAGFWFGHQGYEYVDLGRFWQIALFSGLVLWLVLVLRGLRPALARNAEGRSLVVVFAAASAAIGVFYAAGFFFGARSHLSVMEYWRWWVVHLWVEGFFEVFATAAVAFIFSRLGLIRAGHATAAILASSALFLLGGIPGTFHHLYFSGTPVSIMAIGSIFSALEVVPLVLIGFEAWQTSRMQHAAPWMRTYRWPIRFFVGVAFWNLVGAGLFGFLINPPIALYYMQGLNTTPVHGHTALFGVYGLLSLGLILLVARRLTGSTPWRERPLAVAFWAMNVGLGLMVLLSLLPIGIIQTIASVDTGLWYARSADLLQQPLLENLRWLRIVGDTVFLFGVAALVWFMLGLKAGWSLKRPSEPAAPDFVPQRRIGSPH